MARSADVLHVLEIEENFQNHTGHAPNLSVNNDDIQYHKKN